MAGITSRESPLRGLIRYCRSAGERVYAVVDAARKSDLAQLAADRYGQRILTLFEEPGASHLRDVGPYLVPVDLKQDYVELWEQHLQTSAGILLLSEAEPQALRAHLRTVFRVSDEDGEEYFFRFYDPRVLRVFLPTCTLQDAREFFGPIRRILVESERPGAMLCCSLERTGAGMRERPLASGATTQTLRGAG